KGIELLASVLVLKAVQFARVGEDCITYRWPAWPSSQNSVCPPLVVPGLNPGAGVAAGSTKSVMLCAGTVLLTLLLAYSASARRLIEFAEVNCQTCAVPAPLKFAMLRTTGVVPFNALLMTITVNALSEERTAANEERLSGFGTVADTLVSPNADL